MPSRRFRWRSSARSWRRGSILQKDECEKAPYVVAIRGRAPGSARPAMTSTCAARLPASDHGYSVVHIGDKLVDPDDGDVVGYQGIYVGAGTIRRVGDPSTLFLNDTTREALEGDRLVSNQRDLSRRNFTPQCAVEAGRGLHHGRGGWRYPRSGSTR